MGLVRLFLAAVVALAHFRVNILLPIDPGPSAALNYLQLGHDAGHAVIFFYVISGFLISYALERKYGTDTAAFYKARFLRIFPLFWFLYGSMILFEYAGAAEHVRDSSILEWLPGLALFGGDWSIAFLHYPDTFWAEFPPLLRPAWSLSAEVTFYALAPFILLRYKRLGIVLLLLSIGTRAVLVHRFGYTERWSLHFFPATVMFFLIGHFSRILYVKVGRHLGFINHIWIVIFFSLSMYNVQTTIPFDNPFFYFELLALACAIPFLFEKTKDIAWMNVCGDQSYPLYLSHLLTMSFIGFAPTLLTRLGEAGDAPLAGLSTEHRFICYAVIFLAVALLVSFLLHYAVERPLGAVGAVLLTRRGWWRIRRGIEPAIGRLALQPGTLAPHSGNKEQ